ncbi:hypothetical protein AQUCO_07500010v1 [Aquilegia coerulea]|uniref:Phytocyanin domain-containing protein n=1 Tax=Aquilegia coerulea TaxID=218851 RepID=A0A2G5C937_AQUCA|nr:hypothetical protein AQUCO_07500010v1 [Aquilegia coerulea]
MKITLHLMNNLFFILIIILSTINQIKSEEYTVGDDYGWNTGFDYFEWSQKYNFSVGDILVFNYVQGQHNTYEVTEDTYRSCNSSTGILQMYDSGNDKVSLTEAKKYWFICNIPDHCRGGMKFGIEVKQGSSNPGSTPQPPPPPPTQGSNNGYKIVQINGMVAWTLLAIFGIWFFELDFLIYCKII